MTGQQRVLAALRCEEPDCVPYCEIGIDPAMAARLCGWDATADVERGDIDEAFNIEESPYTAEQAVALADHLYLDNLYYVMRAPVFTDKRAGKHGRLFYGDGRIASVADVEAMQLPDPHDPAALARAREFLAAAGERASFLITRAGIFPTVLSLGWEPFSYALYDDRELVERAAGRFPVSHGAEIGPTDMHASLRSHNDALMDLADYPERVGELLQRLGGVFARLTELMWERLPLFHDGYFDGQYSLWAPGPIARLQEDATAGYSPAFYRTLVQPVDRELAASFECSFMHLHSTSLFLLDAFLEIEQLRCLEINNDVSGPAVAELIPWFQQVQPAGRSLLIRGSFGEEELRQLVAALDPRGLFLLIMVRDIGEVERFRPIVGM